VNAVLSKKYKTYATKGNLNNHIGVPLTLLTIKKDVEMAVIEMGANHQKEIELLCSIAQPDYGYITNFGKAHLEGFGGFEGVIAGKSELYNYLKANGKTLIVNNEDPLQVEKTQGYQPALSFGTDNANYLFTPLCKGNFVGLSFGDTEIMSQLTGIFNFSNLSAAVALGLHFGVPEERIKAAIEDYEPTNMRSQVMVKDGRTMVLDTYNANPSSMAGSLRNFSSFKGSKTIIIGDMRELGAESLAEHTAILNMATEMEFDQIITVGEQFQAVAKSPLSFCTTAELTDYLKDNPVTSKNILLKASRGIGLEKVLDVL
jgi:UDP-N-acetylmuramoyl-tripeptide--D-alanyl-D-alanine ligase